MVDTETQQRYLQIISVLYHGFTYNVHLPASTCKMFVKKCIFLSSNTIKELVMLCITLPFCCYIFFIVTLNVAK